MIPVEIRLSRISILFFGPGFGGKPRAGGKVGWPALAGLGGSLREKLRGVCALRRQRHHMGKFESGS